nr:GGDEF and EAL domain-containing protein [Thiocapsa sp. KS1]
MTSDRNDKERPPQAVFGAIGHEADAAAIERLRERAAQALDSGRFDLADELLAGVDGQEIQLAKLVENLRIYQAELEIQNEELQLSQRHAQDAFARFSAFFNNLPLAGLVIDRQGLIKETNQRARTLFGLRNRPGHQHFFARLIADTDRGEVIHAWSSLAGDQPRELAELHFQTLEGDRFIGDLHLATLPGILDDAPTYICAVLDRTESARQRRALAEATERLRRSESFLNATGEIAKVGGWEMDVPTGRVRWTDVTYRIHDLPPSEDPPLALALGFFHPDDRQLLEHRIERAIARAEAYDLQLRMTTAAGREIWVQTTCQPICEDDRVTKLQGTIQDISHLKRSEEQLEFLAHHDPLTGLANRSLFRARLELCLQRAARNGTQVALLFLDLDRFKYVNDSLGHSVGDQLLERVAAALAAQVRSSDTIARLGGDEFVVIMDDVGKPRFAARFARRLLGVLDQPFATETRELYITASIGISIYPEDGADMDTLLRHADIAMYRAKENGRNGFNFYEPAMSAGAAERLRMEHELRGALARSEMMLHYQPQVALSDCSLRGVEALCRWQHPRLGLVAPDQFIPVAEDSGLIGELTAWVLEQACRQLILWDQVGFRIPRLAVNLPMREIERTDLVNRVRRTLERTGLAPDRLELEVTESMIMRRPDVAITTLDALRALGVILALDDFGTGHSSLTYLKRLPLNRLKMDKSFVERLGEDRDDEAIARAVIALGRSVGLGVIAEGIETRTQHDFLRRELCEEGQGYLYGRPLAAGAFMESWSMIEGSARLSAARSASAPEPEPEPEPKS